jgi:glutamine cyclotransferase
MLIALIGSSAPAFAESGAQERTGRKPVDLEFVRKVKRPYGSYYSEGLDYKNGQLWNSYYRGIVRINERDENDFTVYENFPFEHHESLVWVGDTLYIVGYEDDRIFSVQFSGDKYSLRQVGHTVGKDAWGLDFDGKNIIMVTGRDHNLLFVEPETLQNPRVLRSVPTHLGELEDIAWDNGIVWASTRTEAVDRPIGEKWSADYRVETGRNKRKIFAIDPATGEVRGEYYLRAADDEDDRCQAIDGIAASPEGLWITGKACHYIYLVKRPALSR